MKKSAYFSRCQESYRKDVEREFGVFQAWFPIVRYHALTWFTPQMWGGGDECMHDHIARAQHSNSR
jgi:hypothetical protein